MSASEARSISVTMSVPVDFVPHLGAAPARPSSSRAPAASADRPARASSSSSVGVGRSPTGH